MKERKGCTNEVKTKRKVEHRMVVTYKIRHTQDDGVDHLEEESVNIFVILFTAAAKVSSAEPTMNEP